MYSPLKTAYRYEKDNGEASVFKRDRGFYPFTLPSGILPSLDSALSVEMNDFERTHSLKGCYSNVLLVRGSMCSEFPMNVNGIARMTPEQNGQFPQYIHARLAGACLYIENSIRYWAKGEYTPLSCDRLSEVMVMTKAIEALRDGEFDTTPELKKFATSAINGLFDKIDIAAKDENTSNDGKRYLMEAFIDVATKILNKKPSTFVSDTYKKFKPLMDDEMAKLNSTTSLEPAIFKNNL